MLFQYLNQAAVWRRYIGYEQDEIGQPIPIYEDIPVRVRWEGKRRLVRNQSGAEVVSESRVFCREAVQPGDKMVYSGQEWPVIAVSDYPDKAGRIVYREVAV
ncbi:MAG TPA: hypothetical protein GX511_05920 [Firmicutes bacterium]|nr:hypothetical protein [Bacillota bacterium]